MFMYLVSCFWKYHISVLKNIDFVYTLEKNEV